MASATAGRNRRSPFTIATSTGDSQCKVSPNVVYVENETDIGRFVGAMPGKKIFVEGVSNHAIDDNLCHVVSLVSGDLWALWMSTVSPGSAIQLRLHPRTRTISSFRITLNTPWGRLTFSSEDAALKRSFAQVGSSTITSGLLPGGSTLCCGLHIEQKGEESRIPTTLGHLFSFAHIHYMKRLVPQAVFGLCVTLRMGESNHQRNALWFSPALDMRTVVRLQFELDSVDQFKLHVPGEISSGLEIQGATAVCKKVVSSALSGGKKVAVERGSVAVRLQCSIGSVNMIAALEFHETGADLTFKVTSGDGLDAILTWLGSLARDNTRSTVNELLEQAKEGLKHFHFRRLKLRLTKSASGSLPKMSSFALDIEASAMFGCSRDSDRPVVFLLSYNWSKGVGGTFRGDLWNWFNESPERELNPYFEQWSDLQPVTKNPARVIDLASLVHGQTIEHVPSSLPTHLSSAYIVLSPKRFAVGARLRCPPRDPGSEPSTFPRLNLDFVSLDASYSWGKSANFQLRVQISARLRPAPGSRHQLPAVLQGSLHYQSSARSWQLEGQLNSIHGSYLHDFFDDSSAPHAVALIDSVAIVKAKLSYSYIGPADAGRPVADKRNLKSLAVEGVLKIGSLEFSLDFKHGDGGWKFDAKLSRDCEGVSVADILSGLLGHEVPDVPDFLHSTMQATDGKDTGEIVLRRSKDDWFHLVAKITIGSLTITFAQFRSRTWDTTVPSKRVARVVFSMPVVEVPLLGHIKQPFEEICFLWVQDSRHQIENPGLTRDEIEALNEVLGGFPIVPKDEFRTKQGSDVLLSAGSHFAIILQGPSGARTCILDYRFKKQTRKPQAGLDSSTDQNRAVTDASPGSVAQRTGGASERKLEDSDHSSGVSAPLKKTLGPISVTNVDLKYVSNKLHVMLDASLALGPVGFSVIGLEIILELNGLDLSNISPTFRVQGFAPAFSQPPLTIVGLIKHEVTNDRESYAGGLTIGMDPYLFRAAGYYGDITIKGHGSLSSFFAFAKLEGPLVTLQCGVISGVTAGFGYNSAARIPSVSEVASCPFIGSRLLSDDSSGINASKALEQLSGSGPGAWCQPQQDSYWAMAGMCFEAFNMLSIDVLATVQFGESVKLGLSAIGVMEAPSLASTRKFAHIEFSFAGIVDFDRGIVRAEAQLSPRSFILQKDCHVTGGLALCYWFDAPHARADQVGTFVFTVGGYHPAFHVPQDYPNPPRLAFTWNPTRNFSITGSSYFAVTPKTCMGGCRLHAAYSLGAVSAWFDASADFLINYSPFHFDGAVRVCVGVQYDIDGWLFHHRCSAEVAAELLLWGPPLAGTLHLEFWVMSIDISFGEPKVAHPPVTLLDFYRLVQPGSNDSSYRRTMNEAHIFSIESGMMAGGNTSGQRSCATEAWDVRGGSFSFSISCAMAAAEVHLAAKGSATSAIKRFEDEKNQVFLKPMKMDRPVHSSKLVIEISRRLDLGAAEESVHLGDWDVVGLLKAVPSGLWGKYDAREDPSGANSDVAHLLNDKSGTSKLVMGVRLTAPPPIRPKDEPLRYRTEDLDVQDMSAGKGFPNCWDEYWDRLLARFDEWSAEGCDGELDWREQWQSLSRHRLNLPGMGFVSEWAEVFDWEMDDSWLEAFIEDDFGTVRLQANGQTLSCA